MPPRLRLCLARRTPPALRFLPEGAVLKSRSFASPGVWTAYRMRCLRPRKRCLPLPPACTVTVGDTLAGPCRVDLIDGHDGAVVLRFQADAVAGLGFLTLAEAVPGAFTLGQGLEDVQLDVQADGRSFRASGTVEGPGVVRNVAGSVSLELDAVLRSVTVYQVGHGRLEASLDGGPEVAPLVLHAEF